MSRAEVETTTTLEENFMFGSPPLLKGFAYSSCRSQESNLHQPCSNSYEYDNCTHQSGSPKLENPSKMFGCQTALPKNWPYILRSNDEASVGRSFEKEGGLSTTVVANTCVPRIASPRVISQQQKQRFQNEANFIKRKDLRTLRSVLSKERFRQVVLKFGSFDDEGQEILESVHQTMKGVNSSKVKCLFCPNHSTVYENFPVVDGTLFLTPVRLSSSCIPYHESSMNNRFMCFVCVHCMDGKPENITCGSCGSKWNGSFFQIGTLYAYNILSAIPCCQKRLLCNCCRKPILDVSNGEASTIYFSHFSRKIPCPHCKTEDYHYVKSLSETLRCLRICS